jgi:nucleotide sugar dehydrogenase
MLIKATINLICFSPDTQLFEILEKQDEAVKLGMPAGIALIVDGDGKLIGTISDGDLRRAFLKFKTYELTAKEVMNNNPIHFPDSFSYKRILESLPQELKNKNRGSKKYLSKIILVNDNKIPTQILEYHQLWEQRVASHRHVVTLGMGYVGFTLSLVLADRGFYTTGVDIDEEKINALRSGKSYIHEKGLDELFKRQLNKNFIPSTEIPEDGDVYIISVGTPVGQIEDGKMPKPNLSALQSVAASIGKKLTRGNLVILRSTVPIGTTRDVVLPLLEKESGLKGGRDFHLSFAPERTAEGKAVKELRELPQIIGGINEESLEATAALFRDLTPTIVRVKSLEQAELSKLLNNCFRDLVFSFANQVTQVASTFNINVVDTIRAANQGYPRNPIPLPSPGVGGACLTKDPYIFASVCDKIGIENTLFEKSRFINESMHSFVATRIIETLKSVNKDPKTCNILVCGLAFKGEPETGDIRHSSSIEIAHLLKPSVNRVYGHDPVTGVDDIIDQGLIPVNLSEGFEKVDVVMFLNNHRFYEKVDLQEMISKMKTTPIIFDGWNLFNPDDVLNSGKCIHMGLSSTRSSL